MIIITRISALKKHIRRLKARGKTIGFVPTMGALHQGHLALMRQSRRDADVTVVSVFVNQMQFGPKEDYKKYPRVLNRDMKLMRPIGVDIVFAPQADEMYPAGFKPACAGEPHADRTYVDITGLADKLCGRSRLGHFKGVLTVVNKLFNIVEPDIAYFGQKDYQQALMIRRMVKDLNMNLKVKVIPTVREPDGLAMSSRNAYLTPHQRQQATCLYQALGEARRLIHRGERSTAQITRAMKRIIARQPDARIDYIAVVDPEILENIARITPHALRSTPRVLLALAVYIGKTRLIDNMVILCNQ